MQFQGVVQCGVCDACAGLFESIASQDNRLHAHGQWHQVCARSSQVPQPGHKVSGSNKKKQRQTRAFLTAKITFVSRPFDFVLTTRHSQFSLRNRTKHWGIPKSTVNISLSLLFSLYYYYYYDYCYYYYYVSYCCCCSCCVSFVLCRFCFPFVFSVCSANATATCNLQLYLYLCVHAAELAAAACHATLLKGASAAL